MSDFMSPNYKLSEEDAQFRAKDIIGRDLTPSEFEEVSTAFDSFSADCAVRDVRLLDQVIRDRVVIES